MKNFKHIINEEVESYLNEVGEGTLQPYEYKENTAHDDMFYEFTTEDGDGYVVSILKAQSPAFKYQDIYDVEFKVYGYSSTYLAITNKGRVYRIMATIVEIVKNFLNEVRPNILYFQPTKNRGEEDMRRMNLYLAYVKKAASSNPDYFIENTPNIALIIRKGFINPARYEDLLAFQSDIEIRLRQIDPNLPEAETIESLREILQKYISKAGRYYRGEVDENENNVINDEVQAWHGSQYDFDKFDASKIGSGDGGDVYGWGIYFTNSEEIGRHYGKDGYTYLVTLHKGKTPDQYDWLQWEGLVTPEQREKISNQAEKENIELFLVNNDYFQSYVKKIQDEISKVSGEFAPMAKDSLQHKINNKLYYITNELQGGYLYDTLTRLIFKSNKETSLFLLRAGIDGIKFNALAVNRDMKVDNTRDFNYVVFDPNAVTIEKKIATKNTGSETVNENDKNSINNSTKDGDKYFNNKSTGMGLYDSVLNQGGGEGYQYWNKGYEGEVVYMSPDEYLDKTKKGFGNNRDFDENHILYSRKSQMAIIDAIKQGNKIDMPMLDYSKKGYFGQEGRHRAIVARALGIKEMPVFILYGVTSQDKIKRLNGIIREALKTLNLTGNMDADTKTIQNYIKDNYGNRAHEYMTWTRPDILKNILNRIYEKDNANNVNEEIQNNNHGKLKSSGKRFWIGIASVFDGEIEEVHTYEEAKRNDFHHSFYFSPNAVEKMDNEESMIFWVEEYGIESDWTHGKMSQNVINLINQQIDVV